MISHSAYAAILALFSVALMTERSDAFSPIPISSPSSSSQLKMGLFDMFMSPEEKEKARLRKEREIEEQERLLAEMRERRTNPDKMEEYEMDVVRRRQMMKSEKRGWEKFEEKIGEGGVRVQGKDE